MKAVKYLLEFLATYVCSIILVVIESVKYVLKGRNFAGKITIILLYGTFATLAFYRPVVFRTVLLLLGLMILLFTGIVMKRIKVTGNKKNTGEECHYNCDTDRDSFFGDMPYEEAKREYRRLMKQYHPDNPKGNLDMSQKITVAYSQYCASFNKAHTMK